LITDIPGSSEYFQGGFITYSNILKKRTLKVKKTTLRKYGAVSKEVAIEMAKGAKKQGKDMYQEIKILQVFSLLHNL